MKYIVSLLMILVFFGCGTEEGSAKISTYKDGDKIELASVMGSKITLLRKNGGFVLAGDEDKILILDIFGTFCHPCQSEAPKLMNFQLKNDKDVLLIAFTHFEDVTDQYVIDNFASKFNAYYFIVNSPKNDKIVNTIVEDIGFVGSVQVPLKVVLKNGKYQTLTDPYNESPKDNYYIGAIDTEIIQKDIDRIKETNE